MEKVDSENRAFNPEWTEFILPPGSTNVSNNSQLLVNMRFFNKGQRVFCEDLLGATPLQTSTRGEDIF